MKLIIFLLLLSGSCLGQMSSCPKGHTCGPCSDPGFFRNDLSTITGIKWGETKASTDTLGYDLIMYATAEQGVFKCSHKWVELHQDTVVAPMPTNPYNEIHKPVPAINIIPFWMEPQEYTQTIPLICLICHQQKKKVIHYKRDNR